ncbi:hypothetical protein JB92DRAFT_3086269 [Gautieria morchelliformis]|nr:hypothetical protein JB92DRAFT_3086269 [Gautieria morchelliformis]
MPWRVHQVSLGESATSIPIAAIVGIICGVVGCIICAFSSRTSLSVFLTVMTNFLFLIAQCPPLPRNSIGAEVDDLGGDGAGSYNVVGNVWHLNCCNPESNLDPQGATLGTVRSSVFYWIAVIVDLIFIKWCEVRLLLLSHLL